MLVSEGLIPNIEPLKAQWLDVVTVELQRFELSLPETGLIVVVQNNCIPNI
jgi:ring-1,2-phenylacetyl-CoA epoxidase subunit PaaC